MLRQIDAAAHERRDLMDRRSFTAWFRAAGIRALRTVAQAAIAAIGTAAVLSSVDWRLVGGSALLAGLLSLLTSIAGLPELE